MGFTADSPIAMCIVHELLQGTTAAICCGGLQPAVKSRVNDVLLSSKFWHIHCSYGSSR